MFRLEFGVPPSCAVVKLQAGEDDDPLPREGGRLAYLRQHTTVGSPRVYLQDDSGEVVPYSFLLLECLPGVNLGAARLSPEHRIAVEQELASALIELHSHKADTFHGIGDGPGLADWGDAFLPSLEENRLDMADFLTPDTLEKVDAVLPLARGAFGGPGEPTLIHNDLSPGNIMVDKGVDGWHLSGLVDPVGLQYADVEKEHAYLEAFDTVGDAFFQVYASERPLRKGYQYRRLFYWLDTYMTHVWLGFGPEFHDRIAITCDRIKAMGSSGIRGVRGDPAPN